MYTQINVKQRKFRVAYGIKVGLLVSLLDELTQLMKVEQHLFVHLPNSTATLTAVAQKTFSPILA
jgi:hypothetical protein